MRKYKLFLSTLSLFTAYASAGTWYDDWGTETRDVVENIQHYGGTGRCSYQQEDLLSTSNFPFYQNFEYPKLTSFTLFDTTDAYPTVSVTDTYRRIKSNGRIDFGYKSYACQATSPLPTTYVESRVVGQETTRFPIQPFPQYAMYEFGNCRFGTRQGFFSIGGTNAAQNMKVRVSKYGFPNQVIYNGPANPGVSFNTSATGSYNVSIKFDDGSSLYTTAFVPNCGIDGQEPF